MSRNGRHTAVSAERINSVDLLQLTEDISCTKNEDFVNGNTAYLTGSETPYILSSEILSLCGDIAFCLLLKRHRNRHPEVRRATPQQKWRPQWRFREGREEGGRVLTRKSLNAQKSVRLIVHLTLNAQKSVRFETYG